MTPISSVKHSVHSANQSDNHSARENQCADKADGHDLEKDGSNNDSH